MVTAEQVRELIGEYSPEGFAGLVKSACAPATFVEVDKVVRLPKEVSDLDVRILGVVKDLPGEGAWEAPLLVADVELKKDLTERSSRVRQFRLAKAALQYVETTPPVVVKGMISQGVFVFHDKQGNFRVSLVTVSVENGKFKWSQVKRQSFYVQADPDANATFIQRMCMSWASLKDIKEVFSVEKLTKEFYNQLYKWYERACDDKRVEYPNDIKTDKDNRDDRNRKHLLRLITRLMFVWFLKQKKLVPEELFDEAKLKTILKDFNPVGKKQHQYYRAILQNLFFATLNSEIEEREFADAPCARKKGEKPTTKHHGVKTKYRYADEFAISKKAVIDLFHPIPFLNGGLFECLDQENDEGKVMYYDGFSQQEFHRDHKTLTWAHVPNDLFFDPEYGIIPLLKRYNFTVEENTPGDADVALDPELLGKVFENLLGAYNPETEEVVRKSTGSFYTPREIVNYMVDESLIAYLDGKTADGDVRKQNSIRALVKDGERPDDEVLCSKLSAAVVSAKVLDPACGSGAFPMGALLKMTEILRVLNRMPEDANLYKLKLQLIENCIFGSDIQEIAVQISKLRFFISLVCEQKPNWDMPNYGIYTLPNLETKFVAANSLIGLKRADAKYAGQDVYQGDLFFDDNNIQKIKDDLWEVRHKHFLAQTRKEKNELRRRDKELRTKLAQRGSELGFSEESTGLMADWDPYNQNRSSGFFEPEWMFNVKDGFDIVIGNPPYVEAKKLKEIVAPLRGNYKCYSGTADLSVYFYERGLNVCAERGVLAYICTNKFFLTGYGKPLRGFLRQHDLFKVLNFEQCEVFEGVLVSSVITMVANAEPGGRKQIGFKNFYGLKHREFIDAFLKQSNALEDYPLAALTEKEWSFEDAEALNLKDKIDEDCEPLSHVDGVGIFRGVTTGYNPAFIITNQQKKDLLKRDAKNVKIIKNMLQGRNVRRWYYNESDENLLQTGYNLNIKKDYPEIFQHLKQFEGDLKDRADQGVDWWNLRACKYYDKFELPEKIVWALTSDRWAFALDDKGHYLPSNGYILTSVVTPVKYILGLLNSRLMRYYFRFIGVMTAGGAYTLKAATIEALPYRKPKADDIKDVVSIVTNILIRKSKNKGCDVSSLEKKIDAIIYKVYGLAATEVEMIDAAIDAEDMAAEHDETPKDEAETISLPAQPVAKAKRAKKPQFAEEF